MRCDLWVLLTLASLASAQGIGFWETRPRLATARQEVGAAELNGKLWVAGGLLQNTSATATVECFDPVTQTWTTCPSLPTTLHHFGMTATGGKLYAIGGYVSTFVGVVTCWMYDPATQLWARITDLPQPRGALVAVAVNGKVYALGGVDPRRGVVGDCTEYDPQTNTWRTLAPMPTAREHLAAAVIGNAVYAVGGRAGQLFGALERFDPATNSWSVLLPMPTPRGGTGAAVLQGKLVVCGGEGSNRPNGMFDETEEYDPATNRWRQVADMAIALHGIYPVAIGSEIVVAGGATVLGYGASDLVLAFRTLPTGVNSFGLSTPACAGAIRIEPTALPTAGNTQFALWCSPAAPAGAAGVLAIDAQPDAAGTVLAGLRVHLALTQAILLVPSTATPAGTSVATPLPAGNQGATIYAQFAWINPGGCTGPGPLSGSDALAITVQ